MHIVQIAPYFPPYPGGQEKYVFHLSQQLLKMGHRVTILTSNFPAGKRRDELDGLAIHRYACWGRPLRNPLTPGLIFSPAIPPDADILHTHNLHSFASNAAILLRQRAKLPLVLTSHGQLAFDSPLADAAVSLYTQILGKMTAHLADKIITATPSEKNRLVKTLGLPPSRIEVIPVGIDLPGWDELAASLTEVSPLSGFEGRSILLVATQLIRRKGIHHLLDALPLITCQFPDVLLAIAGAGEAEPALKGQTRRLGLERHTHFCGLLTEPQLARAYQAAQIFILPSLGEGQPTCIMEAWAFSRPVIATRIEGVTDYYGEAALLVEPGSPSALAEAVICLLGDKALAQTLGRAGRALVESRFTWDKIAAQMVEIYLEMLESRA